MTAAPDPAIARDAPPPGAALAALAMTGSAACWGGATVMTKAALASLPPFATLCVQLSASVAALWAAVLLLGLRPPFDRRAGRAALGGLLEPGLAYGVGVPGLALTSAASASAIGAAEPALIVLLGWLAFGQRVRPALIVAVAAAGAGVALVTLDGAGGAGRSLAGDLLILAGTGFAALYVLVSRGEVARMGPLPLAALQQTAGLALALALLALARVTGFEGPAAAPPATLALVAASGVVQYALAFWLYLVGLRRLPAGVAGLFLALTPVFGMAGAVAALGEAVSPTQAGGAALVVATVAAMALRSR